MNQSAHPQETVNVANILRILRRSAIWFVALPLALGAIGYLIASQITPRFKSQAVISIQGSYFENPLINDLVRQISDPGEVSSQRASLLRVALSDEFLDFLAKRHQQYTSAEGTKERALERELFGKRIEFISLGPTNYQISAISSDAKISQEMVREIVEQIRETLITQRLQMFTNIRYAVRSQLTELSKTLQVPLPNTGQELSELQIVDKELNTLLTKFTASHPRVTELLRKRKALIETPAAKPSTTVQEVPSLDRLPFNRRPLEELYADLAKKLNYLNVVMTMEGNRESVGYYTIVSRPELPLRPFFPSKRIFALGGAALGLFVALCIATVIASKYATSMTPLQVADHLGVVQLGELLMLPIEKKRVLDRNRFSLTS